MLLYVKCIELYFTCNTLPFTCIQHVLLFKFMLCNRMLCYVTLCHVKFQVRNECHIWDKLEKKTAKLKIKAWEFWMESDEGGSKRTNAAKIPVVKDTLNKFLKESGNN